MALERMGGRPRQEGSPLPLRGEEGRVTGQSEHLRMVKFGNEEEQVKETRLFSQVRQKSSWVDGWTYEVGCGKALG